jgi:cyclic pyranopterin monophosphate synthase
MPFTHVDSNDRPTMVDVSGKAITARSALAESRVRLPPAVADALREAGYASAKGPILQTAIIAGTMAAKRTHELIPFCHPLGLDRCRITIESQGAELVIRCEVAVQHRTGVEMEALTGAAVAALTLYDMCKALSHDIVIGDTRLLAKSGGKSDYAAQEPAPLAALVLAGGRSTRMRTDKAALAYRGETQLLRVYRLVASVVPDVYVSVRADQASDPARRDYRQIVDSLEGVGPAAGILSALASSPPRAWLVVAVDLPFLERTTLEHLIAARDATHVATAYRSRHDGLPEPLCAIWEPAARAPLAAAIASGASCPRKFLTGASARLIELVEPTALDNVNTPGEYAEASARLDPTVAP